MPHVSLARFAPLCAAALATGISSLASAAPASPDATVAAAKKSPMFKRELRRRDVAKAGLNEVAIRPGVTMDFRRYLKATAIPRRPGVKPLMDKKLRGKELVGRPLYKERIIELSDRLIVDRELTVELTPGTCAKPKVSPALEELCFSKKPSGKLDKHLLKELEQLRKKLAGQPDTKLVAGTTTVGQAKSMSDEQLVGLLLNGDTRTIRHVSIVPRKATPPGKVSPGTRTFGATPMVGAPTAGLAPLPTQTKSGMEVWHGPATAHDREYFLTGGTLGDEISDTWEYTFAAESWWHDRYFVRVDYNLGFGFGLRAPFSVDVSQRSTGANTRAVAMKVAPVDVDSAGLPAYPEVGLSKDYYYGGNEFVLEFDASCHLKVSIPGPDINKACPKISKDYSRDIDPVIGSDASEIKTWWLNGSVTGLGVTVSAASASVDIGLGADVTNGKVGMTVTPLASSQIQGLQAGPVWFTNRDALPFEVKRTAATAEAGFKIHEPRYAFDVRLRPKLRAKVGVDVGIYENDWTLGPWALDFLAVSASFQLEHHARTVAAHEYPLFGKGSNGQVAKLPSAGGPPSTGPSKPPKEPSKFPKAGFPKSKLPGASKQPTAKHK